MNYLQFLLKISILFIINSIINAQTTVPPIYSQFSDIAIGKVTVIDTFTYQNTGWISYSLSYNKTLPTYTNINAIVSIISFQSYIGNQFSFNTSLGSISVTGFNVNTKIIGNSYFKILSLQYAAISFDTPLIWFSRNCFLCSNLTQNEGDRNVSFPEIDLNTTNLDKFQRRSFISGLRMYNNNETYNYIKINNGMKIDDSFLYQNIYTKKKTQIQWVCISTVIVNKFQNIQSRNFDYVIDINSITSNSPTLNWSNVPEQYSQDNQRFFGFSRIQLNLDNYQFYKFLMHTERNTDFKIDVDCLIVRGAISYFFIGQFQCSNTTASIYYDYIKNLCYDICLPGKYPTTTIPLLCDLCHYSCQTCSEKTQYDCLTCNTTWFRTYHAPNTTDSTNILNDSSCPCTSNNYLDVGVQICVICSDLIPNCDECNATNFCTLCQFDLIFDALSNKCICPVSPDYFIVNSSVCFKDPGCLLASDNLTCTDCDILNFFTLVTVPYLTSTRQTCQCLPHYIFSNLTCIPQCGDGFYVNSTLQNCDDGNLITGDGCDNFCNIQTGFGCLNVQNTTSICSPLANFQVQYLYTERIIEENTGIMYFAISPPHQNLSISTFKFNVSTTIPNTFTQVSYEQQNSLIKIKFKYTETVQQKIHAIQISFDPTILSISQQNLTIILQGSNYKLSYDSDPSTMQTFNYISIVASVMVLIVTLVLIVIQQKLPGTQLLLSSQIVYLACFSAGNNSGMASLMGLKYLAGINGPIDTNPINYNNYQISHILPMGAFKQYILNFNFMIIFQILSIILILPFKIKIWRFQEERQALINYEYQQSGGDGQIPTLKSVKKQIQNAKLLLRIYQNKAYYPISLICTLPLIFYFGLQAHSANINNIFMVNGVWSIIVLVISLLFTMGFLVFLYQDSSKKNNIFVFLKKSSSYPYYLIFIYVAGTLIYTCSLSSGYQFYIITAFTVIPLIYRLINNPYPKWISIASIDSFSKFLISIACIGMLFVSRNQIQNAVTISLIIEILLIVNCLISIVRVIVFRFIKDNSQNQMNMDQKTADQNQKNKDLDQTGQHSDRPFDLKHQNKQQNLFDQTQASIKKKQNKLTEKFKEQEQNNKQMLLGTSQMDKIIKRNNKAKLSKDQLKKLENDKNKNISPQKDNLIREPIDNIDQQNKGVNNQQGGGQQIDQLTMLKNQLRNDLKQKRGLKESPMKRK